MANPLKKDETETAFGPSASAGVTAKKPSRPKLTQPPSSSSQSGGSANSSANPSSGASPGSTLDAFKGGVSALANTVSSGLTGGDDKPGSDIRFAGSYGDSNVFQNLDSDTPAFSNTPEGTRLTAPPSPQNREAMEAMPELSGARPESAVGSLARARENGLTQPPETVVVGQDGGRGILSRSHAEKRSDRIRYGDRPELLAGLNQQRRDLGADQEQAEAQRQFERGQTQAEHRFLSQENAAKRDTELEAARIKLTPPPSYLPDSEGNLARVQGTEARPVTGPDGEPFRQANDGKNAKREAFLSVLEDLTPDSGFYSDEERQRAVEFAQTTVSEAYGDDDPEEPTFREGDLVFDNKTGQKYYFINGELVPYEAVPADRRPR